MEEFFIPAIGAFLGIEIGLLLWELFFEPFLNKLSNAIRWLLKK